MKINFYKLLRKSFSVEVSKKYLEYIKDNKLADTASRSDTLYEVHHILPRSLYPEYEHSSGNLVKLKPYDHFVAHYLLAKSKNHKMLFAFNMMNRAKAEFTDDQLHEAALLYSELKSDFVEAVRIQALTRDPWSKEARAKVAKRTKGMVAVIKDGESFMVSTEEFYRNRDQYSRYMEGRTHSEETKKKMSENGINGLVAFTHNKTNAVVFRDPNWKDPNYTIGNLSQSDIATERFTGLLHWTNSKTGQVCRSAESPGKDWVNKRTFNNPCQDKSCLRDLKTGKTILIPKGTHKSWQVSHNKLLFLDSSKNILYIGHEYKDQNSTVRIKPKDFVYNNHTFKRRS